MGHFIPLTMLTPKIQLSALLLYFFKDFSLHSKVGNFNLFYFSQKVNEKKIKIKPFRVYLSSLPYPALYMSLQLKYV